MTDMKKILLSLSVIAACLTGCADKPYVIVQIADAQLGFTAAVNHERNGGEYINDLTYESECLTKAVCLINDIRPDAVVFTGDQVHRPENEEQWETLAAIVAEIDPSVKTFHIPGNHDVRIKDAKVDSTPFTDHYGEDRFCHSEKGVTLIGLNTNLIKSCDSLEGDQINWIKASLGQSTAEGVTIIFGHHPFFLTDIDEGDSYFPVMSGKRRFYFDMFLELGVDAVYAGHKHESFEGEYNGIPMKTTTAVGYQLGNSKPSVRVITVRDGKVTDELVEI